MPRKEKKIDKYTSKNASFKLINPIKFQYSPTKVSERQGSKLKGIQKPPHSKIKSTSERLHDELANKPEGKIIFNT